MVVRNLRGFQHLVFKHIYAKLYKIFQQFFNPILDGFQAKYSFVLLLPHSSSREQKGLSVQLLNIAQ